MKFRFMKKMRLLQSLSVIFILGVSSESQAVDSASFEFDTGNKIEIANVGMQWKWKNRWRQSNGTHLGGYWDLSVARWREIRFHDLPNNIQSITSIGITPVFRFQSDTLKGGYAEVGIGANYLSGLYDNNRRKFSTRFEFGDRIGVGYVFQNNIDLGLGIKHYSNAGMKHPNNGVTIAVMRLGYQF